MIKTGKIFLTLVIGFILLLFAPIVLSNITTNLNAYAATPTEIKNHIRSRVDDQIINIPNHSPDSFGKFLWGLAGCESTWNENAIDSYGLFHGLYQYTTATWQSINSLMGVSPTPSIYDGIAQVNATIYIINNPATTGGFNHWPGCTDGRSSPQTGPEWTDFVSDWIVCESVCNSGAVRCFGSSTQKCRDATGDGCTEWVNTNQTSC